MDVYKRSDGKSPFWSYDIKLPDGSRARKSTGERDKAKARKVMLGAIGEAKQAADAAKASPTLWEATQAYLDGLAADGKGWHRTAASIRARMFGVDQFADKGRFALARDLRIADLTEATLKQLRAARRAEGLSQGSISHELRVIRASSFVMGVRPAIKWNIPSSDAKMRWVTPEEWRLIYDELAPMRPVGRRGTADKFPPAEHLIREREQAQDLFVALTLCGGRWGEVTSLTDDTILPGGRIRLYGRKTGKERIVPLPALAGEAMQRRLERAVGHYLFPSSNTSKAGADRIAKAGFQTSSGAIKEAFKRSGVNVPHKVERDGKATIHSLRHTFASWCVQAGMTLSEVQELLGHSTSGMTQRYAHLLVSGAAVERATTVMDGIVGVPS